MEKPQNVCPTTKGTKGGTINRMSLVITINKPVCVYGAMKVVEYVEFATRTNRLDLMKIQFQKAYF